MTTVEIPAGLTDYKARPLAGGALIEYEFAPAGSLRTATGEVRAKDYRAYLYSASSTCDRCEGSGRVPSEKRAGNTIQCPQCKGSGAPRRQRLTSVTTLLGLITEKGGLPWWSEARGIEGAVQAMRLGEITTETHPADAVKIVRDLKLGMDRARDDAADRGVNVHALLEHYMRTGEAPNFTEHPDEHHGYLRGLCSWLLERDPEPESVEELVCDPEAGFAGRRDLVARVDGRRVGYDAKTQKDAGIYLSAHLQLRLYERGSVVCGEDPCDELVVVVFAENGEWREMPCLATSETVEAALAYWRAVQAIDRECQSANIAAKKARRS